MPRFNGIPVNDADIELERRKAVAIASAKQAQQAQQDAAPWENDPATPWENDPLVEPSSTAAQQDGDQLRPRFQGLPVEGARPNDDAQRNSVMGKIDSAVRGAADTLTLGTADEISAALNSGSLFGLNKGLWGDYDKELAQQRAIDSADAKNRPGYRVGGQVAGALAGGAGLVRAGLSPTAKLIDLGASLGKVSGMSALEGAALGAAQGFGSGEGGLEERAKDAGYGAIGGAVLGGAAPAATKVASSAIQKTISPFMSSPERAAAVDVLKREGINTTAGQATGSRGLRYAESELGGNKAADLVEKQGEQFTKAALKRAGIDASRATPDVIDDAFNRIGQTFDGLAARNQLNPDGQLAQDLGATAKDYLSAVPESMRAPVVMETINDIGNRLKAGPLDGAAYQSARSRLDRFARSAARDPQLQDALYGIRNALDDAMERSIGSSNPRDLGAWKDVRNQYRNLLVIEKAATGAGEDAALGLISPSKLRQATVTTHGRRNYARGNGDFAELSRAGEAVLKPLPNSGTAPRLRAQNLGSGVSALLGGGAGYLYGGDPSSMAAGTLAGIAAPRIAGAALMSPVVQALLRNQAGQKLAMSPARQAVVNAMVNGLQSPYATGLGRSVAPRAFAQ